jgi:hypothetical protein
MAKARSMGKLRRTPPAHRCYPRRRAGWLMRGTQVAQGPQVAQPETEISRMASTPAKP